MKKMIEYISREAAIKVVQQPGVGKQSYDTLYAIQNLRALYPDTDVVRVIRCRDCIHYANKEPHTCDIHGIIRFSHNFCDQGKASHN